MARAIRTDCIVETSYLLGTYLLGTLLLGIHRFTYPQIFLFAGFESLHATI